MSRGARLEGFVQGALNAHPPALVLGLLTVLVLAPTGVLGVSHPGLLVDGDLSTDGSLAWSSDGGAIHLPKLGQDALVSFSGERVDLTYTFRDATQVGLPDRPATLAMTTNEGETRKVLEEAAIRVLPDTAGAELLVVGSSDAATFAGRGSGTTQISGEAPAYLTRFGDPPDEVGTGDEARLSFWYETPGAWLHAQAFDEASALGDLLVFINNATVEIQGADGTSWRNWTGTRTEGTGPSEEIRERLLLLRITSANLKLQSQDDVAFLNSDLTAELRGMLRAQGVEGTLELGPRLLSFQGEPLELRGDGTIALAGQGEGTSLTSDQLLLTVQDGAAFEATGGRAVATEAPFQIGILPSLLVALVTSALVLAYLLHRNGTWNLKAPLQAYRQRRYATWMTRGRMLAQERDWESAVSCFRRATRASPEKGLAWFHLALAAMEADDLEATLGIVDEAKDIEGVDTLDLLEIEAEAAFRAGDLERCNRALLELAHGSKEMAGIVIRDLGLTAEVLGSDLVRLFGEDDGDGGLPGYV